ncbi:MAG: glycosyltransferase family 2 protein [Paracoccaceae bacterium]
MATAIFDIPLAEAHRDRVCAEGYGKAQFILREGPRPVGTVTVPVVGGRVSGWSVLRAIRDETVALAAAERSDPRSAKPGRARTTGTAAICTRERPDDLRRCLAALVGANAGAEILVVDNAPATGATRDVAAGFPQVRYVMEPAKGLDNARNRALQEARTEVVAFIDDDAVADRYWLQAILRPFDRADVAVVTGLTLPYELENDAQEEFEEFAGFSRRGFRRREFRLPHTNPLHTGPVGAGANMAVRRSVIAEIGPFDPALDAGTPTLSGGDHEFFSRVLRAGHSIVYEPAAMNRHRHRRTRKDMIDAVRGYGTGTYALFTRTLLEERDPGVLRMALGWFYHDQFPDLLRGLTRSGAGRPLDVVLAELRGCLAGPRAYHRARRIARGAKLG